ncbi:PAS domain-containing protein [Rhodobacter sp. 24-YEA-8]|uniref:sensor histidine kinase n=1 Tax=Rhodobacter sp. 24-YEA-8 TaxID=1884310 RepID=UPI0008957AED|nr:PAS domain-containing protein [Rhodobacter sp. 24-YEA-8]SED47464.1 PAS domain S-box-containing protein [Rhodobacter sp. 24-YEA-8]
MAERLFSGNDEFFGTDDAIRDVRAAILSVDWGRTAAGPVGAWPLALRYTVRTMLYAASPMAVLIGREGVVVCNDAAREIFGDAWTQAQGRPVFESLPIARKFYRDKIDDAFRGKSHRLKDQPIRLIRDGAATTCWFNLGLSPIIGDDGEIFGTLMAASETTTHIRTKRALTLAQERVEVALEAGGIVGTWDFDVRTRKMIIDGALAEQYGIPSAEARSGIVIETLFENLHEEDRGRVLAAVDEAVASGANFHSRFRTITPDGILHWYVASGRPILGEAGGISGFAGIVIDTTNQSEVTAALEASNLRFDTLVEAIPQIVWSTDPRGNHDFFNRRWSDFTGIEPDEITPELWTELVHPEDQDRVQCVWKECLKTGRPYDIDYRFRHQRDGYRWLRVIALPMRDAQGRITRWYGTSTDIEDAKLLETERELVNRELDHRIGNLFALVNGLISLSARDQPGSEPFVHDIRERLGTLHKAHRLIKAAGKDGAIPFRQVLEDILAPYAQNGESRGVITGDRLQIRADSVSSFALVFHELATNSAKYGAMALPGGKLFIALRLDAAGVSVEWREKGSRERDGGAGGAPDKHGFGSKLLSAVVEGQFRGTFERLLTPEGMCLTLRLPRDLFDLDASWPASL